MSTLLPPIYIEEMLPFTFSDSLDVSFQAHDGDVLEELECEREYPVGGYPATGWSVLILPEITIFIRYIGENDGELFESGPKYQTPCPAAL